MPAGSIVAAPLHCDRGRTTTTRKEAVMFEDTQMEEWVELADRANDGLDVRLYWNRADGRVKVAVTRIHTGKVAELRVAPEDAMTAFHHPFAYHEPAAERSGATVAV
jgi:hypothetical protein